MDLINSGKSLHGLLSKIISLYPHNLTHGKNAFKPPTIVWTSRSFICNDIKELLQYKQQYGSITDQNTIILSRFPGMKRLCSKHEMADRLNIMRQFYPGQYNFFPHTYIINTQMSEINRLFEKNENMSYIIKTSNGFGGSSVTIVFDLKDIFDAVEFYSKKSKKKVTDLILQKYCNNPLLKDGYKFDFRIYVVIKSLEPFEIYILREGLCRICTTKYQSVNKQNYRLKHMHFTNFSINKDNVSNKTDKHQIKMSIDQILFELKQQYKDKFSIHKFWKKIDDIVKKTAITLALPLKWRYMDHFNNLNQSHCFHIVGFDILIDDQFELHLLEINDSPSFSIDSDIDFQIKSRVIETTLQILNVLIPNDNIRDIDFKIDTLYSLEEKLILKAKYKKFKLSVPSSKWFRHSQAILHQNKTCSNDQNLFRLFEDDLLFRIFNAYSTRFGCMNATKWISFCQDFGICGFLRCSRNCLDLIFREYQTKLCGKGGGEVDLEGFCHVLLLIVITRRRKIKKNEDLSVLEVWLMLMEYLFSKSK